MYFFIAVVHWHGLITLVTCLEFKLGIVFSLFNTYFPLHWKKRITEFLSCFISSLMVKVIKFRFVAPGEGFYQDGCVSLIKYGTCFTRPLHLNDTYFDTLQFFFSKNTSFKFSSFFLCSSCEINGVFFFLLLLNTVNRSDKDDQL